MINSTKTATQILQKTNIILSWTDLKVVSDTFLFLIFFRLKESIFETRKNVFHFTVKGLLVLEVFKF